MSKTNPPLPCPFIHRTPTAVKVPARLQPHHSKAASPPPVSAKFAFFTSLADTSPWLCAWARDGRKSHRKPDLETKGSREFVHMPQNVNQTRGSQLHLSLHLQEDFQCSSEKTIRAEASSLKRLKGKKPAGLLSAIYDCSPFQEAAAGRVEDKLRDTHCVQNPAPTT